MKRVAMANNNRSNLLQACLVGATACLLSYSIHHNHNPSLNRSKDDILHAISGAIGSALSITVLYPLETVRTRLQVDTTTLSSSLLSTQSSSTFVLVYNIGKKEGVAKGLYKGWFSLVVALMALNFVYFYFFHALRRWVGAQDFFTESLSSDVVIDLGVGYVAGVIAVLVTGPLWLVNTRLKLQGVNIGKKSCNNNQEGSTENEKQQQQQHYTGICHCIYKISKEEGIQTLWNGTLTSIILATNPAINLGIYMMLKRHHLIIDATTATAGRADDDDANSIIRSLEPFVNALLSKFIATIITYPIQVLQTRHRAGIIIKQNEDIDDNFDGETKQSTTRDIGYRLAGMYRGLESKLLQTCLNSAIMFVVYERLVDILTSLMSR